MEWLLTIQYRQEAGDGRERARLVVMGPLDGEKLHNAARDRAFPQEDAPPRPANELVASVLFAKAHQLV